MVTSDLAILIGLCFATTALILLVVLVFLYKLTLAVGRLGNRIEELTRHLRDLNLYELQSDGGVLSPATDVSRGTTLATGTSWPPLGSAPDATPSGFRSDG